jgi:hypothetical protein
MMSKKFVFGILVILMAVFAGWWLLFSFHHVTIHEYSENTAVHTQVANIEKISVWQSGSEKVIGQSNQDYTKLANTLALFHHTWNFTSTI